MEPSIPPESLSQTDWQHTPPTVQAYLFSLAQLQKRWQRFLNEPGVEPTNSRAERALRFRLLWRKSSLGTASVKGNAWVQRSLLLRQTCRQLEQSTFSVLVDALEAFMNGRQPDLSWIR